ncbi:hypothetical protein GCM10027020_27510 [Nocardioides salsibiostraticola]
MPESRPDLTDWERKRRIAAVFGDVLPETTSDEREEAQNDRGDAGDRGDSATDRWLKAQVPPHHG